MCFNFPVAHWRFSLLRNALPVVTFHGSPAFILLPLWVGPFSSFFFFNPSTLVYLILWAVKWGLARLHLWPSYWSQCGFFFFIFLFGCGESFLLFFRSFTDTVAMCGIVCSHIDLSFYVFARTQAQNPPIHLPLILSSPQLTWGSEGWYVASRIAC